MEWLFKAILEGHVAYVAKILFSCEYLNTYWRLVLWYISTDLYRGGVVSNLFPR